MTEKSVMDRFRRNSGGISQTMTEGMDSVKNLFGGYVPVNPFNVETSSADEEAPASSSVDSGVLEGCFGLSYAQRIVGFLIFVAAGVLFFSMTLMYTTTMLLGSMYKFVFCYTLAYFFLIFSSSWLVGLKQQLTSMFEESRRKWTLLYLTTLVATLYFTF